MTRPEVDRPRDADDGPPPLWRDPTFHGMNVAQFLGAFNDNVFKQMILLLAVGGGVAGQVAQDRGDQQWAPLLAFAVPFLLFSGVAGYLSERFSKRTVIVLSKAAEILVMALGVAAFAAYGTVGLPGLYAVLFLMAAQSAFFGPGKYGILPEVLRPRDLPTANGVFLMMTFTAIIFGVATGGAVVKLAGDALWKGCWFCVLIAVAGTATSLLIRHPPPANPGLPFSLDALAVPSDVRRLFRRDRSLLIAILVQGSFWLVGGLVQPAVNALGRRQLGVDEFRTSLLNAAVGVGIAVGCVAAGRLSRGRVNFGVMRLGAAGIVVCLAALAIPAGESTLLGYAGALVVLLLAGASTGLFVIPLQVFVQSLPPPEVKGRVIATMNLVNWLFITLAAILYWLSSAAIEAFDAPRCLLFVLPAAVMLPVLFGYRPRDRELGPFDPREATCVPSRESPS